MNPEETTPVAPSAEEEQTTDEAVTEAKSEEGTVAEQAPQAE